MNLQKVNTVESNFMFHLFKKYMEQIIDDAIGWDDDFQFNGFTSNLHLDWFNWLIVNDERVGVVCYHTMESKIQIHLLIVFEEFQGQHIATDFLNWIELKAKSQSKYLSLNCFKNNSKAISLYLNHGFTIGTESKCFYNWT